MKAVNEQAVNRHCATQKHDNNILIRNAMTEHGLKQWQVAAILGIREEALSRKLRREIPLTEQVRIVQEIERSL